jgi:hypothetical protein
MMVHLYRFVIVSMVVLIALLQSLVNPLSAYLVRKEARRYNEITSS